MRPLESGLRHIREYLQEYQQNDDNEYQNNRQFQHNGLLPEGPATCVSLLDRVARLPAVFALRAFDLPQFEVNQRRQKQNEKE